MKYYFLALAIFVFVCVGCVADGQQVLKKDQYHAPPAAMLQRPGPMVDGPGPGVMPLLAPPPHGTFASQTTEVRFVGPPGMRIGWRIGPNYAENQLVAPGRYNFPQAATYRLKFTYLPGREGVVLYPTLQIYPAHPTTDAYLSHNSVPIEITDEDLDQVESNNFVTKVIYLPDPRFQELAIAGVETLVSTRLDPGVDPVAEADRRGTIMVVLRMGNIDLEKPSRHPGNPDPNVMTGPNGIEQMAYHVDGEMGQHVPPVPIGGPGAGAPGVPNPMIVAGAGPPGRPGYHPISGVGGVPVWGMPMTGTPIGLPGPPHLPFGGPAGLQSHTVRNLSDVDLGNPVNHMLIDVRHEPGISLPKPVEHVKYKEKHPVVAPSERAMPAWAGP